jgi:hypothetical protein
MIGSTSSAWSASPFAPTSATSARSERLSGSGRPERGCIAMRCGDGTEAGGTASTTRSCAPSGPTPKAVSASGLQPLDDRIGALDPSNLVSGGEARVVGMVLKDQAGCDSSPRSTFAVPLSDLALAHTLSPDSTF